MRFQIEFSPDAQTHLRPLRIYDRKRIVDAIATQLESEPLKPTRNRKLMRSNLIATWELRIGDFRVYYDVIGGKVLVRAIGIKHHGRLVIGDQEVELP
jgi:mRNA-degrading endonuclease RelE of RelBE toxin-antitoxin system